MFGKQISKAFTGIILSIFIEITFTGCNLLPKEEKKLEPPLLKQTEVKYNQVSVTRGDIINQASLIGTLMTVNEKDYYYSFGTGILKSIDVAAGQTVKKGDVLAELDTSELDYQILQQQTTVELAQVNVDKNQSSSDPYALKAAQLQLQQAKQTLDHLKAQKQSGYLTADVDGTVIGVAGVASDLPSLKVGQAVPAYQIIVKIAVAGKYSVRFTGDEKAMTTLPVGKKVQMTYKDKTVNGTVGVNTYLSTNTFSNSSSSAVSAPSASQGQSQTSASSNYLDVIPDDLPVTAVAGESLSMSLTLSESHNTLLLPAAAVNTDSAGSTFVYVLQAGNIKTVRPIKIGLKDTTDDEILSGLNEGDKVVN